MGAVARARNVRPVGETRETSVGPSAEPAVQPDQKNSASANGGIHANEFRAGPDVQRHDPSR